MKTCSKCGTAKRLDAFHKKAKAKDGLKPSCKECVRVGSRAYYLANADRIKDSVRAYQEKHSDLCREQRKRHYREHAQAAKERSNAWAQQNRERRREIVRKSDAKRRLENPAYARESYWRNIETSRERGRRQQALRRASGNVPFGWWRALFDLIETGVCLYCGSHGRKLTMDHWMPVALGGRTEMGNLIPCCKSCNSRKGSKHPDEWKRILGWDQPADCLTIERILQCSREAFEEDLLMRAFNGIEIEVVR